MMKVLLKDRIFLRMPPKFFLDLGLLTYTLDGQPIIEHGIIQNQQISDEIVVEITRSHGVLETLKRRILTHPDRVFEYE